MNKSVGELDTLHASGDDLFKAETFSSIEDVELSCQTSFKLFVRIRLTFHFLTCKQFPSANIRYRLIMHILVIFQFIC